MKHHRPIISQNMPTDCINIGDEEEVKDMEEGVKVTQEEVVEVMEEEVLEGIKVFVYK